MPWLLVYQMFLPFGPVLVLIILEIRGCAMVGDEELGTLLDAHYNLFF